MRMRKKKNLEAKLADVSDVLTVLRSQDRNYNTAVMQKEYLDLTQIFASRAPLELEIGCGKGRFLLEKAQNEPDRNFLGVEINPNVALMAAVKLKNASLKNAHILVCRAEYLPKYLKDGSAEKIYLNFSCPFPKKKYESHRLTSERFLSIYASLLSENGEIFQKTDNARFFEYSIEQLSGYGYALKNVTLDLHSSALYPDNIMTEYERRFTDLGQPIYALTACLKRKH